MPASQGKGAKKLEPVQKSGIQPKVYAGFRIVDAYPLDGVSDSVPKAVERAIINARRKVGAVAANENGQLIMFEDENDDEVIIPEDLADVFIKEASEALAPRNLLLQKAGGRIEVVMGHHDPWEDQRGS
ncbi:hypothetical protein JXD20_00340 [Candidatus Peregrinibacteria bacterium]|nr:hypothetical protein [Candidatus Peregrinibacteria bacterium]